MSKESRLTSINSFKSKFTSVRPTLFQVIFPSLDAFPFLKNQFLKTDKIQDVYIYCKSAKLPQSTIEELSNPYFGRYYYEGTERTFNTIDVTFYNSQDFAIRNFIEFWMNNINGNVSNSQVDVQEGYNQFMDGMIIRQLDRRENKIKDYTFFGLFPINCSEIDLDFSNPNTIEEFIVSFRFQYFTTDELEGDDSSTLSYTQGNNVIGPNMGNKNFIVKGKPQ